jgi:hypothetical protein
MHRLHLTEDGWIRRQLLSQSETGMGYQIVDIHLRDGRVISRTYAVNTQIIYLPARYQDITEDEIAVVVIY